MGWTAFDTVLLEIGELASREPSKAKARLEEVISGTERPGDRLRLLGYLIGTNQRLEELEAARAAQARADEIPLRLAKALAFAESSTFSAALEIKLGHTQAGISRTNAALDALSAPNVEPKTVWGRRRARQRAQIRAALYIVRGQGYLADINTRSATKDACSALNECPVDSAKLPALVRQLFSRTRLSAITLLSTAIATGKSDLTPELTHLVDDAEEHLAQFHVDGLPQMTAAQLAKCRAVIAIRLKTIEKAEIFLAEALHHLINAGAAREFEQTLDILCKIVGPRAQRVRNLWQSRLASSQGR